MSNYTLQRFFLVALLLLATGSPASALERRAGSVSDRSFPPVAYAPGSPIVFADVWDIAHFITSGGRTRIVQMCVVAMCLALFIMMRKLHE